MSDYNVETEVFGVTYDRYVLPQYVRTGNYPGWMSLLGRWDMMFRKGVFKLPMSHLFYVLGRKR